ncbi:Uncharacterised protein [Candidatus Venteria ishoeyi]|uniref:DGQHR domain protein n=2 Tax=Candidatus Venteria ishoeyi TaxID=1899563 RepID=A0A1H6F5H2_9GAMM|nr:Uncharacterised protein [Candidatus Venteria ishoeyi]
MDSGHSGTLYLPTRESSGHIAWVVDGQKRYLALTASKKTLAVPVVAFITDDLNMQREQFMVCNRVNPLPEKMLNELLPKVNMRISSYLPKRQIPAALCDLLNNDPDSPFYTLMYLAADKKSTTGVISDSVMIKVINRNLKTPLGVLFQYQNLADGASDTEKMYDTLSLYWGCVREVFPDAWGNADSLLMQAPGLEAMSILMDKIMLRAELQPSPRKELLQSLQTIAPFCRWTSGTWEELGLPWNKIKPSVSHIRSLSDYLIRLDFQQNRSKKG